MNTKYQIHPVDAVIVKHENDGTSIKIALCNQGSSTTPEQRKEAEMMVRLLNWYDSIDKKDLSEQLNSLRTLSEQFDSQTLNGDACEVLVTW